MAEKKEKNLQESLIEIQKKLKAPKGQYNSFGKYKYRSCEDILEAVKPLLCEQGVLMTVQDDLTVLNDRFYIRAIVTVSKGGESICSSAFAREDDTKKGMDGSQITGTASSYARKYALNGLFLIDDTKDADTNEHHNVQKNAGVEQVTAMKQAVAEMQAVTSRDEMQAVWSKYASLNPAICESGTEFYQAAVAAGTKFPKAS